MRNLNSQHRQLRFDKFRISIRSEICKTFTESFKSILPIIFLTLLNSAQTSVPKLCLRDKLPMKPEEEKNFRLLNSLLRCCGPPLSVPQEECLLNGKEFLFSPMRTARKNDVPWRFKYLCSSKSNRRYTEARCEGF